MIAVVFAILNADITTVNVALVTLGKDLHADLGDLQWGLNSYMLAFAALIVAAGRVADVFGRRRCLLAGAILFAVASLLCGIASTLSVLVIGRVLQGAAGALMVPAGMAIISNAYGGEQRALALGTLVGVSGVAQSMGPLLGGFLTAEVSWRWVFLMNLPLVAVIMIVAVRSIQESHAENASHRIDIIGVIILAAALTSLLLGLNAAQSPDKDQVVGLGLIALSLVSFVILTFVERRTDNAILDGKLLRLPSFLCSCVASFLLGFVFFLFLFITAVYLQERLGYNALTAGIALAPLSLVLAVTGVMSGRLTSRFPLTDSVDHKLRLPGLRTGDPFVYACILRICWNGASVSAHCRWRRSRIYFAEHRWPGCDFRRALRPGYGNDLHVSVCRRRDRSLRRQCTSQRDLSPSTRFQIIRNPVVICPTKTFGTAGCSRTNQADRQRLAREPGGTSPSGVLRIVRGGIHRHAAVECDSADRDRHPDNDADDAKEGRN